MTRRKPKVRSSRATTRSADPADPAVRQRILDAVVDGKTLRQISVMEGMPSFVDLLKAIGQDDTFEAQYLMARKYRAHQLFDEVLEIADKPLLGEVYEDENGKVKTNWEAIGRSKLRIEARQYITSRLSPQVYGDKIQGTLDLNHHTSFDEIAKAALEEREKGS